ncbi:hypothetical protein [Marinitenerispora sediminis]|uniref:hypothetical protein n=1 Tax=Marinitenerispora sediminis TaxID=1931232 RepID=UPI0011C07CFF|nr:hypothetical protein [Marinitenerispora sediminis]
MAVTSERVYPRTAAPEPGLVAARVLRPASRAFARWAARTSVTPSALSRAGLLVGVLAALWFTEGGPRGAVVGTLLLGAALLTDTVAEELDARRTALDAWLAVVLVRLREYAVYAGLAAGGAAAGVAGAWTWAAGALIAHAMVEAVASARAARPGRRDPGADTAVPGSAERRPAALIETVDPSRPPAGPAAGDPGLLDELLGTAAPEPAHRRSDPHGRWERTRRARAAGPRDPSRRTAPRDGRPAARPDRVDEPQPPHLAGRPAPARSASGAPDRTRRSRAGALRRLLAFGPAERFVVIGGTLLICNVKVTFLALIVGSALALTAALAAPSDRESGR